MSGTINDAPDDLVSAGGFKFTLLVCFHSYPQHENL